MAKKKSSSKNMGGPGWTAEKILKLWKTESKRGLGSKVFEAKIHSQFEPRLLAAIQKRLNSGHLFKARDERNTRTLANALGQICKLVTVDREVSVDTFQKAFGMVKGSQRCPNGGGGGEWCDI